MQNLPDLGVVWEGTGKPYGVEGEVEGQTDSNTERTLSEPGREGSWDPYPWLGQLWETWSL